MFFLFPLLRFTPERLATSSMQRRPTVRLPACLSVRPSARPWLSRFQLCARWPALHKIQPLPLSLISPPSRPFDDSAVNITVPLSCPSSSRALSLVHLSFNLWGPLPLPQTLPCLFPPSVSPTLISCWLFIRRVNNCLPTVIIAPRCQPGVWSKAAGSVFTCPHRTVFSLSRPLF